MPSAVVEIRKKFLDAGKARGAVIDAAGTRYSVKAVNMGDIQEGGVYELFWEDKSYQGKPWRDVQTIKAHQSKTAPAAAKVLGDVQRARTAREDEIQINRRHRLTWIGERMDAVVAQLPLSYKGLRPVSAMWAEIYDNLAAEDDKVIEKADEPQAKQPFNEEIGDDIPY